MFFPGTLNIFTPGDSAFMLLKCMCNNTSIEKKSITLSAQLTMISVSFSLSSICNSIPSLAVYKCRRCGWHDPLSVVVLPG